MEKYLAKIALSIGDTYGYYDVDPSSPECWVAVEPILKHMTIAKKQRLIKLASDKSFHTCVKPCFGRNTKNRGLLCIPLEDVTRWLCTLNLGRTIPSKRELLLLFKKRLQISIYEHVVCAEDRKTMQELTQQLQELKKALGSKHVCN